MTISFTVPGRPVPMARPRVVNRHAYTPERCRVYKDAVALCAKAAMKGREPISGACKVSVRFLFGIPISWTSEKHNAAACGRKSPTARPDLDNLYKSVTDAMNGIIYADDSQIVDARMIKGYAINQPEGAYIEVNEV